MPLPALTRAWDPTPGRRPQRVSWPRHCDALDLDVLHTHNPKTGVLGRLLGRAVRIPVVVNTCHGLWAQGDDPLGRRAFVLGMEVVAGRASDAELYQNAEDRETLARWVPQGRARVVGNGTDLTSFGPDAAARTRVRAEWGIPDGALVVGGVGRMVAEKGIRELGEAAKALAGRARFVWVGPADPDKPDALEDETAGVQSVGGRDDMASVYNAFDVFVLPSYREGFSRSGMEAAATGLPLVLSDIRGCREVGRHEQEALLVAARDPGALTAAIGRLLDDPALRGRLGAAARVRALAEFDQVRVAAISLETYAAVARRKATRLGVHPGSLGVAGRSRSCLAPVTWPSSAPVTSPWPRQGSWSRRRSSRAWPLRYGDRWATRALPSAAVRRRLRIWRPGRNPPAGQRARRTDEPGQSPAAADGVRRAVLRPAASSV